IVVSQKSRVVELLASALPSGEKARAVTRDPDLRRARRFAGARPQTSIRPVTGSSSYTIPPRATSRPSGASARAAIATSGAGKRAGRGAARGGGEAGGEGGGGGGAGGAGPKEGGEQPHPPRGPKCPPPRPRPRQRRACCPHGGPPFTATSSPACGPSGACAV